MCRPGGPVQIIRMIHNCTAMMSMSTALFLLLAFNGARLALAQDQVLQRSNQGDVRYPTEQLNTEEIPLMQDNDQGIQDQVYDPDNQWQSLPNQQVVNLDDDDDDEETNDYDDDLLKDLGMKYVHSHDPYQKSSNPQPEDQQITSAQNPSQTGSDVSWWPNNGEIRDPTEEEMLWIEDNDQGTQDQAYDPVSQWPSSKQQLEHLDDDDDDSRNDFGAEYVHSHDPYQKSSNPQPEDQQNTPAQNPSHTGSDVSWWPNNGEIRDPTEEEMLWIEDNDQGTQDQAYDPVKQWPSSNQQLEHLADDDDDSRNDFGVEYIHSHDPYQKSASPQPEDQEITSEQNPSSQSQAGSDEFPNPKFVPSDELLKELGIEFVRGQIQKNSSTSSDVSYGKQNGSKPTGTIDTGNQRVHWSSDNEQLDVEAVGTAQLPVGTQGQSQQWNSKVQTGSDDRYPEEIRSDSSPPTEGYAEIVIIEEEVHIGDAEWEYNGKNHAQASMINENEEKVPKVIIKSAGNDESEALFSRSSHFIAAVLLVCLIGVTCYLIFYYKNKLVALLVEGRQTARNKRINTEQEYQKVLMANDDLTEIRPSTPINKNIC